MHQELNEARLKTQGTESLKKQLQEVSDQHQIEIEKIQADQEIKYQQLQNSVEQTTSQNSVMAKMQEKMLQNLKDKVSILEEENRLKEKNIKDGE